MEVHTKRHEDGDHTCTRCDFEGNSKEALAKHIETKHMLISEPTCKFCGSKFTFRYQLTNHIMENHGTHKPCTNFAKNKCEFDNECRFKHIILREGQYICYTCGQIDKDKTSNMKHLKTIHGNTPCKRFEENRCGFSGKDCIYSHILLSRPQVIPAQPNPTIKVKQTQQTPQVFQQPPMNQPPPNPMTHPPLNPMNQPHPNQMNISDMVPELLSNMMTQMTQLTHIMKALSSGSQIQGSENRN